MIGKISHQQRTTSVCSTSIVFRLDQFLQGRFELLCIIFSWKIVNLEHRGHIIFSLITQPHFFSTAKELNLLLLLAFKYSTFKILALQLTNLRIRWPSGNLERVFYLKAQSCVHWYSPNEYQFKLTSKIYKD